MIWSFSILWSSRPIFVSSSSSLPQASAFFSSSVLTISSILRRAAMPFSLSCKNASCAAVQASLASAKTPNFSGKAVTGRDFLFVWSQPQDGDEGDGVAGVGTGADLTGAGLPFSRSITSVTTSRMKVSFTALMMQIPKTEIRNPKRHRTFGNHRTSNFGFRLSFGFRHSDFGFRSQVLLFRTEDLFSQHIHHVHDADDDGVHGRVLQVRREARRTALREQHHFADARTDAVHGDDGVDAGTEFGRVLFVHELRAQEQQFASVHVGVLLCGDHRAFDLC